MVLSMPVRDSDSNEDPATATLEEQIVEKFQCVKCTGQTCSVRYISTTGSGLSKLMNVQNNKFLIVTCENCGYSEMYDGRILGAKTGLADFLDVLFGLS